VIRASGARIDIRVPAVEKFSLPGAEAVGEFLKRCQKTPTSCGFNKELILSTITVDKFVDRLPATPLSPFPTKDFLTLTKKEAEIKAFKYTGLKK
jgi:hypothetical protein